MAADYRLVTELTIDASGVKTAEGQVVASFKRIEKQQGDTAKVMEATGAQSAARLKANYERLAASFDPVTEAQRRHSIEFQKAMKDMERASQRGVIQEQQAAAVLSQLRQRQIAEINKVKEATLQAAAANNNNSRGARAAGVNIGYQFQDIAMMATTGQNPFVLAMQQGTQLAGILSSIEGKGVSAFRAIGIGLSSLFSWNTLIVVGLTAATAALVQYGQAWLSSGGEATRSLEEQNKLIDTLAEKYGTATGLLKQWNDERKRGEEQADVMGGINVGRERLYGMLRNRVDQEGRGAYAAAFGQVQGVLSPEQLAKTQAAWGELLGMLETNRGGAKDTEAVMKQLQATLGDTEPGQALLKFLKDLSGDMEQASIIADKLEGNLRQLIGIGGTMEGARLGQAGVSGRLRELQAGILGSEERNRDIRGDWEARRDYLRESGLTATEKARRGASRWLNNPLDEHNESQFAKDAIRDKEREAKAAEQLAKQLEREAEAREKVVQGAQDAAAMAKLRLETFGMEEGDRKRMLDQLKTEQDLRSKGKDLTATQAQAYRDAAAAVTEYGIQLDELEKQQKELNEQQEFFSGLMMDGLNGMISGGEKLEDVMKKIGLAIADAVLKAALLGQGPLASFFGWQPKEGQSVGGLFGDFFSAMGGNKRTSVGNNVTSPQALASTLRFVGGAGGANNSAGGNSSIAEYIMSQAPKYGINPSAALRLARAEGGLSNPFRQAEAMLSYGREQSFGPFQLHMRGGMGANALRAGIDPRTDWRGGVDFALSQAQRGGWGPWMGRKNAGLGIWDGIDRNAAMGPTAVAGGFSGKLTRDMTKLSTSVTQAAQGSAALAQSATGAGASVGKFGDLLSQFPAAPGGGSTGIGGMMGMLGGLPSFGFMNGLSPAASSWITGGGGMTGLWANGGAFPNGISGFSNSIVDRATPFMFARGAGIMGEAGPEAIMPLQRGPGGRLGVAMHGGGGGGVVIHNYGNNEVTARETNDNSGRYEVVIEERYASRINTRGTPLNKAVRRAASNPLKRR